MYKLHLYFYRIVMFYMCMVQEKIGSNQPAVDVPKCKYHTHTQTHTLTHTQPFKKGPGDTTPKFRSTDPLAWTPASTVTSKAWAMSAHHTCIKQLAGDGSGARGWVMVLLSSLPGGKAIVLLRVYLCQVCAFNCFYFFKWKPRSFLFGIIFMMNLIFYIWTKFYEKQPTSLWNWTTSHCLGS